MFTATCTVEGRKALNQLPKKRKKDAEQEAAKQALIQIGISDPDKVSKGIKLSQSLEILQQGQSGSLN